MSTPLLIMSDAVTSGTGLGRITRDLATRIAAHMPEYRVGTLGYGGSYSRQFNFPQYEMDMRDWVVYNLPEVWEDFAGNEQGAIMTIWDASRLLWFTRPETCPDPRLQRFLQSGKFKRWGYLPIDATGPHDRLTAILRHTIEGYDRVLAYSAWAEAILNNTLTNPESRDISQIPHGIDTSVFFPRNRNAARKNFGVRIGAKKKNSKFLAIDDEFMIGIVATNQIRKDYGLGIQVVAELAKTRNVMLWIHTDVLERHWSIPALLNDFGLLDKTVVTTVEMSDEHMSFCYSACDVTLGIGLGEGFGYPIFESLACGTPCIHGDYGGAPEHMRKIMCVPSSAERLEGLYNCVRNVYHPSDWITAVNEIDRYKWDFPSDLDWTNLWPRWEAWFRKGLI